MMRIRNRQYPCYRPSDYLPEVRASVRKRFPLTWRLRLYWYGPAGTRWIEIPNA